MTKKANSTVASVETPKKKTLVGSLPHSHKIELTSPTDEDIKFWIKIKTREASMEYMFKLFELNPTANEDGNIEVSLSPVEQYRVTAELAALAIESWDEENIGLPFTYDNAVELLVNPVNNWIKTEIEKALDERSNFFTVA